MKCINFTSGTCRYIPSYAGGCTPRIHWSRCQFVREPGSSTANPAMTWTLKLKSMRSLPSAMQTKMSKSPLETRSDLSERRWWRCVSRRFQTRFLLHWCWGINVMALTWQPSWNQGGNGRWMAMLHICCWNMPKQRISKRQCVIWHYRRTQMKERTNQLAKQNNVLNL